MGLAAGGLGRSRKDGPAIPYPIPIALCAHPLLYEVSVEHSPPAGPCSAPRAADRTCPLPGGAPTVQWGEGIQSTTGG